MATNVIADNRVFDCTRDDGTVIKIRVRRATRRELEAADLEQSRLFNQALLNGLPPRTRMLRKLREQDLWTSDDDQKLNDLRGKSARADARIAELDKQLGTASKQDVTDDDKKIIAQITADKEAAIRDRQAIFRQLNGLRIEIDGMLGHTADAKADDAHRNFVLACVAEYVAVDGEKVTVTGRVWPAVDNLMAEQDTGLLQRTVYEYMTFSAGLPSEWEKDNAAQKALEGGEKAATGGSAAVESQAQPTTVAA